MRYQLDETSIKEEMLSFTESIIAERCHRANYPGDGL